TAARLADCGVRLITIGSSLATISVRHHSLSKNRALKQGLTEWRRDGISSLTVVHEHGPENPAKLAAVEKGLRELGMPYRLATVKSGFPSHHFLATLPNSKNSGVLFLSST